MLAQEVSEEPVDSDMVGFRFYGDNILPVFTSPESCSRFAEVCDVEKQGTVLRLRLGINPFELSDKVEFLEQRGYEALCFDPLLAPGSAWWTREGTILLSDYRRSIEEICPIFEKLGEEAVGQFCQASHLREEPFVRWPDAGIEEIAADIRARVEELIDCDDS